MAETSLERVIADALRRAAGGRSSGDPAGPAITGAARDGGDNPAGLESVIGDALRRAGGGRSGGDLGGPAIGGGAQDGFAPTENLGELSRQLSALRAASLSQIDAAAANTRAVLESTVSQTSGIRQGITSTGTTLASVLGSGLGLAPAVKALLGLFTGSSDEAPPALPKYIAPPPLRFEAGNVPGGFTSIGYGQGGNPRLTGGPSGSNGGPASYSPQVTIQVQAMDSRSFMDHSDDIARAVREAMLNMHPMNDVVNDL